MAVIYGINPVLEQISADPASIERIHLPRGQIKGQLGKVARKAREKGIHVTYVDRSALSRLAEGGAHQGVVAKTSDFKYRKLEEIIGASESPARLVVLDGVQDPRNLGSIVRTAVCAGAAGIVLPDRNSAGMTAAAVKTSAGAAATAKIARVKNLVRALETIKKKGFWCVALESKGEKLIDELDPATNFALVFGGEGKGIRRLVRERCDITARLPMRGPINSLNVSVAVGVALYALLPKPGPGAKT